MRTSINIILAIFAAVSAQDPEDNSTLPLPHIIIIGATGVGKSSLANVFIGEDPTCTNCTFPVCGGASSCTKNTNYAVKPWLGDGQEFTVVDTPGFGDTDQEDSILIDEMMTVLKDIVKSANVLFLALDGSVDRFSESLQQMLREMRALFGDNMWDNMIVGVSKWSYSQSEIDKRNRTCITTPQYCRDEKTFSASMMNAIEEKFHIGRNLTFVFIDSWAKHPVNIEDVVQQEAFTRETDILWNFANMSEEFQFKSIQDVLDENAELRKEVEYLNENINNILDQLSDIHSEICNLTETIENEMADLIESLDEDLVEVRKSLEEATTDITNLRIETNTNAININHLKEESDALSEKIDKNEIRISANEDALIGHNYELAHIRDDTSVNSQDISTLRNTSIIHQTSIDKNTKDVQALGITVRDLDLLPLGTIISYHPKNAEKFPDGWLECNGQDIQKGPLVGNCTPDLNNAERFLRGGSGAEINNYTYQESQVQKHTHEYYDATWDGGADSDYIMRGAWDSAQWNTDHRRETRENALNSVNEENETRPKNMKVVFVMKCWHQSDN